MFYKILFKNIYMRIVFFFFLNRGKSQEEKDTIFPLSCVLGLNGKSSTLERTEYNSTLIWIL